MRLATRARYSVRLMVAIGRNSGEGKPTSMTEVAARTRISRGYLEQLALFLRNAALLKGVCGRKGGYFLARPPEDITLAEIVEAAMGPINLSDCISSP
ncbi:MAG: Rrf2 family transcriptional regulator, partial [Acidobacteriota bacterium]